MNKKSRFPYRLLIVLLLLGGVHSAWAQFNFNAGNCTQVIGDNVSGVSVTVVNIPNGDGRYSGIQIYYNPVGTNQHAWFRNGETCSNVFVDEVPQGDLGFTINATYNGTIGQGAANNGTNTATYMFSTPLNAGQVLSWNVTAWATEANTNAYVMGGGNRVNVTIGGCQDNDAPTMGAATLVRAGKSKVVLNLSATDDICVTRYQITGNINGTPVDMTVPAPGCGAAGEVSFNLPVEITGTHPLTIRAIDGTGKQSANTRTVNVTANTTGPTNVQATFGSSTPSSITLNNVSATPGTGGAIVAYKVTYGPNNEYSQTIVPNGNQLTVSALKTGTNYNGMRIYAIDDMGNVSTTYRTINTASTQNSAATSSVCAEVRAVNGELYGNWERFEQRAIISAGRSAADEFAILVTPYPGTWPLEGVYINTEAGNGIPGGDIIVNAEQGKIQSNSVVFQNTTGTVEFVDTQIGGTTVQSILVKVKYNTAVGFPQFYLGWRKVRTDNGNTTGRLTGEDGGFFYVNDQNSYCNNIAVDNQNFTANWPFGDPTTPDAPSVLNDDPIDTTPQTIEGNPSCGTMVYGTNFASAAGGDHLTIDDILSYDVTHSSVKIEVDPAIHEGYVNGGFMDDTDNYAIVENPHVLDGRLKYKDDGQNRLIIHLHKATNANEYNILSLPIENLTPETKVTVRFDYEFVSDKRENGDWRAIAATLGNTRVNATDAWSGSVEVTATALTTTLFSISVWGAGNSDALAISNLRIYGCVDHTLQPSVELPACEGTDVTLETVGYDEATTGFTWQHQVNGVWQTIAGQTSNKLVVTAELQSQKIRAIRGGIYTDVIDVQGVVCCDNEENKKVIWHEDFGTVPAWTRYQYPRQDNTENWVVGHGFRDYGTRPGCTTDVWIEDPVGSGNWVCPPESRVPISYFGYTDTPRDGSNPWYYGEGFGKVDDGDYVIVSNSTYAEDGCGWVKDRPDHTGNPNGGFLLINVAPTEHDPITGELIPTQIIEKVIDNVKFCSGVWYNFSIWASQLAKRNQLPSSFYLEAWGEDAVGNQTLLGSITTGVMRNFQMDDWSHYGITFDPGESKKVILKVFNMGEAGAGNDIVLDDLSLTVCYPDVELFADYSNLRHDADVMCGGFVHMGVEFDGEAARYFSSPAPYYLWQKCEWDGANEVRTPWVSIPAGNPSEGSGYHGDGGYGAGHTGHNFLDQDVAGTVDTTYYRVIMAGSKEIAEQIAADLAAGHDYTGCDVYNVSEIAKVSCFPCLKPDVAFTFTERTICRSEAVGNFTQHVSVDFEKAEDFMNYYEWQQYVPDAAHRNTLNDPLEDYWTVLSTGGDKNGTTPYTEAVASLPYPQDSTLYRFLARNGRLGCDSTYVFKVFVKPNPVQPVLSTDPGCDQPVIFTIENYGVDTTYTWTVNSATVTATNTYTVPTPGEDVTYLASVIATFDGCSSPAGTASQTYIITPDVPVVSTDPGCDHPVVFTITSLAPAGKINTYAWTVNGSSGTGEVYSVVGPTEGTEYNASVTATRNGCTSAARTASQTYIKTPVVPTLSNNAGCDNDVRFTVTNYDAGNSYAWELDGVAVTAANTYTVASPESGTTYNVSVVATKNGCSSAAGTQSQKRLVQPTITIKNAAACADDRLTYSATVTVSEGTVTTNKGTIAKQGATNDWLLTVTITDGNDNAELTVVNADGLCANTLTITEPDCSCPDIAAPTAENKEFCDQLEAVPTLTASATLGANEEIQWFDVASGGTPIATGASYTPATDGTYYVQVTNTLKDCYSPRVPVTVTRKSLPAQPVVSNNDGCDNQVEFTIGNYDAANTYTWTVSAAGSGNADKYTVTSPDEGQTYNASVTATLNGCTSAAGTGSQMYKATPEVPTLTGDPGCDNDVVFTIGNYNAANTYAWTVDGAGSESGATYTVTAPTEGQTYNASVTATRNGCTSAAGTAGQQYTKHPVTPTLTVDEGCDNPVVFTLSVYDADATYNWTLNQGAGAQSGSDYTVSNPQQGETYTASVEVTKFGCSVTSNTVSQQYKVTPSNVGIALNPNVTQIDCTNPTITLTASGDNVDSWSWSNGASVVGTTNEYAATAAGTYTVTATGKGGCTADAQRNLTKDDNVPAAPTLTDNTGCGNDVIFTITNHNPAYTYTWTLDNNPITVTGDSYQITAPEEGHTYEVSVSLLDPANGCTAGPGTGSQLYKVYPVQPVLQNNAGCDEIVKFTDTKYTAGTEYYWSVMPGDGTYANGIFTVTDPEEGVTYTANLRAVRNGCEQTAVPVDQMYTITPDAPTLSGDPGCDKNVVFTIGNYAAENTYTWTVDGAGSESGATYTVTAPTDGQTYNASVTATRNGCTSAAGTAGQQYTKHPETPALTVDEGCDNPVVFTLSVYDADATYNWTLNQGAGAQSGSDYTVSNPQPGETYTAGVEVTKFGCSVTSNTVSQQYKVTPSNVGIALNPNVTQIDCTNPTITLTASGDNVDSWSWSNGASVVGSTNVYAATEAADYTVTATGKGGCTADAQRSLTKDANVPADPIMSDNTGCDEKVIFTIANYNAAYTYTWTLDNNPITVTGNSYEVPTPDEGHTYEVSVSLVDPANGCTAGPGTGSQMYKIYPAQPVLRNNAGCDEDVIFTIESPEANTTFDWTIDGVPVTATTSYTVTDAQESTTYNASVTATRNGCTSAAGTQSQLKEVTPAVPVLGNNAGCDKDVIFTIQSPEANTTFNWTIDGNPVTATTTYTVTNAQESTTYQASVTATRNSCTSAAGTQSQLKEVTPAVPVLGNNAGCDQQVVFTITNAEPATTYAWTINGNSVTANTSYTVPGTAPGTDYQASVTATRNSCTSQAGTIAQTYQVTPTLILQDQPAVCAPTTQNLALSLLDYDGTVTYYSNANCTNELASLEVAEPGTTVFYVKAEADGCTNVKSSSVTIHEIDYDLSENMHLCYGDDYSVEVVGLGPQAADYRFSWTSSDGETYTGNRIRVSAETSVHYELVITNGVCTVQDGVDVEVNPLPQFTVNTEDLDWVTVQLNANGYEPYRYEFNHNGWMDEGVFERPEAGIYTFAVEDNFGCVSEQDIPIERILVPLVIPPFFTPDGDGQNDLWIIENIQYYPTAIIKIYDRFHKLVAEYDGTLEGWDGFYRGHPLPSTDYWYYIKVEELGKPMTGHVTLYRGDHGE